METAGLINIGDELLRGQIIDTNGPYLANNLCAMGIKLCKISVLPDNVEEIAQEVLHFSKRFSVVFTCGGVGPTFDDVTYEAICKAFDLKLETNSKLMDLYSTFFPKNNLEFQRFATVPTPCETIEVENKENNQSFGVVKIKNVYVLPGSPKYFKPAIEKIMPTLQGGTPLFYTEVDVALEELSILKILEEHVSKWKNLVFFGSYPQMGLDKITKITFQGSKENATKAKECFVSSLPPGAVLEQLFTLGTAQNVIRNNARHPHVQRALKCVEKCFDTYAMDEIFLSFNGGKDCTVVLHLAATVMRLRALESLTCFYLSNDSFSEVEEFVSKATNFYGLELKVIKEKSVKSGLSSLIEEKPRLKICLMGTRKNDPGSENLEMCTPTDPDWPEMLRVNPILDWSYKQVWDFLRYNDVPYCSLYDQGYSSLGAKSSTLKNPLLADPENPSLYRPAHTLADDSTERHGRKVYS